MIRRRLGCVVLTALLAFAACSREAQSYESLSALSEAVSDAGVPCDRIEPGPKAELVSASGSCNGSEVTIYMFDNAGALENWTKVGARLAPTVVGPNWAVTGDVTAIETLADELDAELVSPRNP